MPEVMKTLLLNPPSFENFDGGASSRWPATREIESYWYPVWLTYPAGMLPGSRLLDASPHKVNRSEEHTSELQSHSDLVCRLLLEKKNHGSARCPPAPWTHGFLNTDQTVSRAA